MHGNGSVPVLSCCFHAESYSLLHFLNSRLVTNILIKFKVQNLLIGAISKEYSYSLFLETAGNVDAHFPSDRVYAPETISKGRPHLTQRSTRLID